MRTWLILPFLLLVQAACDNATGPATTADDRPAGEVAENEPDEPAIVPDPTDFLAIVVDDPRGDNAGPADVDLMRLAFNKLTGEYRITLVAYDEAPFRDSLRVNINLLNWDLDTVRYPAFFSDTMNDMMLNESTTVLVLEGVDPRLMAWEENHRVFTNSLGGSPNPDGASLYRSSVTHFPMGFLTNEDVIAFHSLSRPALIEVADGLD
jgi:hypothetical protein